MIIFYYWLRHAMFNDPSYPFVTICPYIDSVANSNVGSVDCLEWQEGIDKGKRKGKRAGGNFS